MRKRLLLMVLVLAGASIAADISSATLSGTVTITETSGSAQTDVIAPFPLSTQGLIDGGFLNANTLNAEIHDGGGSDVTFMPAPTRTRVEGAHEDNGGAFTNETTDANDVGANDVNLLPAAPAVNDAFYVLADHQFRIIEFNIGTAGARATTPWVLAWEYYNGAAYTALSNIADGTDEFRDSGTNTVSWDIPNDMAEDTINGTTGYSVRARVTDAGTGTVTRPLGTQIWYETGIWWTYTASLGANEAVNYDLFVGGSSDIRTEHMYIFDDVTGTGMSVVGQNITTDFAIEIRGIFDGLDSGGERIVWEINNSLEAHIRIDDNGAGSLRAFVEAGSPDCFLTAPSGSLPPGLHTIRLEFDATNDCELFVDGGSVATDTSLGSGVPSSSNWDYFEDDCCIAIEYARFYWPGFVTLEDEYEFTSSDDAITITDRADGDRDGTPDWPLVPTTVTGTMGSLSTTSSAATATSATVSGVAVSVTDDTNDFTAAVNPSSNLPGYTFLNAIAGKDMDPTQGGVQGVPIGLFYLMIAGVTIMLAIVGTLVWTKQLWMSAFVGGIVAAVWVSPGVLSPWFLMWYAIFAVIVFLVDKGINPSL